MLRALQMKEKDITESNISRPQQMEMICVARQKKPQEVSERKYLSWVNQSLKNCRIHKFGYFHPALANRNSYWKTFFKAEKNLFEGSRILRTSGGKYSRGWLPRGFTLWHRKSKTNGFPWRNQYGQFFFPSSPWLQISRWWKLWKCCISAGNRSFPNWSIYKASKMCRGWTETRLAMCFNFQRSSAC